MPWPTLSVWSQPRHKGLMRCGSRPKMQRPARPGAVSLPLRSWPKERKKSRSASGPCSIRVFTPFVWLKTLRFWTSFRGDASTGRPRAPTSLSRWRSFSRPGRASPLSTKVRDLNFPHSYAYPCLNKNPTPSLWFSESDCDLFTSVPAPRRGWLIDPGLPLKESLAPGSRALIFRMSAAMRGETELIRKQVEDLKQFYSPDLLLLWPGADDVSSRDAEVLQNDFAMACLESRA